MIWLSPSLYSKCTVFTVNLCYLKVLAMYKKALVKRTQSWIKVFLFIGGFLLTYNIILF